jgi:ornithine decarboxylase
LPTNTALTLKKQLKLKKHEPVAPMKTQAVESILSEFVRSNHHIDREEPFYVADLGEIERQYTQFTTLLPRVRPFYAVKCNPDPAVMLVLANCGAGFDCASKAEIRLALSIGVPPSDIIYANPCKQRNHIKYASTRNVNRMTFDNEDELYKIKSVNPNAELVLRILTDDSKSRCRFGVKFGASIQIVPRLLQVARELRLNVVGVSFHVGSGCFDAQAFVDAVVLARKTFDIAETFGYNFKLLDIGGGFPGNKPEGLQFSEIARVLRPALDELFDSSITIIAEPGRYFVSTAYTLAVNVTSRRVIGRDTIITDNGQNEHPSFMYYVNDGMYGAFNCITFDHQIPIPIPLFRNGEYYYRDPMGNTQEFSCSIWGPTCDSIDLIAKDIMLPQLHIGDWLVFKNMGAYTLASSSNFNGFKKSAVVYTNTNY